MARNPRSGRKRPPLMPQKVDVDCYSDRNARATALVLASRQSSRVNSRCSQARANSQSRSTVLAET